MKKILLLLAKLKLIGNVVRVGLLVCLIISKGSTTFCQNNFETSVIPPSPTSFVFLRYGNDQPSLQTGTVNIPITLYNIEAKGLTIPLSLTYQTSGININEVPYPAGYGWVFSAGFRITRVVLGRPDDRFTFRQSNANEDYETIKRGILDEGIANLHQLNQSDLFDTQKDIFTLHMPSGSFNFFIKKIGSTYEIITIGHQIKIEALNEATALAGFKVTDGNGIIYKFGYDNTSSFLDYTEPYQVGGFTAWMLREITLLNNEKINFSWQKVNTNAYASKVNSPISINDRRDADCPANPPPPYIEDPGGIIDNSSYNGANSLMLKKIEYPGGVVDLTYKSTQDPFLQNIVIKNKNNYVVKNINLTYGTSTTNASNCLLYSLGINDETYNFQYNSNYFGPLTTALDYWGFYNGKTTNSSLIPNMTLKIFTGVNFPFSPIYQQVGYADRSVSADHMKAFMLTRINFPTGGYSDYEYEPHQFPGQSPHTNGELFYMNPDPISSGGGLRVSRILTYSLENTTPIIKTFKYGPNENGLANSPVVPTLETFIDEMGVGKEESSSLNCTSMGGTNWRSYRQMTINAFSNYSKYVINKNPIWYTNVTEYINSEQKTEYTFSYDETYGISWQDNLFTVKSPYAFRYDNLFNNGPKLTTSSSFKKVGGNYIPVQQIVNEYENIQRIDQNFSNVIIDRKGLFFHQVLTGIDLYPPSGNYPSGLYPYCISFSFPGYFDYHKFPYTIAVQYDRLKKTTTTLYDNGQAIENYVNFFYNSNEQLIKTVKGTSINGQENSVTFKYPNDFSGAAVYDAMVAKNIISPVIEQLEHKNSTSFLQSTKTNYNYWYNGTWGSNNANSLLVAQTVETKNFNQANYETRLRYHSYDDKGNLTVVSKENDVQKIYIWGYNKLYPVAEVIGASYTSLMSVLNQSVLDNPADDATMRTELNKIRINFPSALATTYTYKPLVGMTSQTDVNNRTSYYFYDAFGRLAFIRDKDNNVLKKFCYNYKGQQENCTMDVSAQWQSTGNYRCVLNGSGQNTGYQEREERDNNSNSITYNQLRWVDNGYNASACPPPSNCNYSNCGWEGYRCVYGQCEQGYRINTYTYYDYSMGQWVCVYHYEFSDGSWSSDYYEYSYWQSCYQS